MISSGFTAKDLEREPVPHWALGENGNLIINEGVLIN